MTARVVDYGLVVLREHNRSWLVERQYVDQLEQAILSGPPLAVAKQVISDHLGEDEIGLTAEGVLNVLDALEVSVEDVLEVTYDKVTRSFLKELL